MSEFDRVNGAKGGDAKQAKRQATIETALADWPKLDSIPSAQRRLELIGDLSVSGLLAGSAANAACRSVELWLRSIETEDLQKRFEQAERTIRELERELETRGVRRVG